MGLPRRVARLWRRASFTFKFATVILAAGAVIAVVPLLLTQASTRSQAEDRATDKVGIAQNLVTQQRESLTTFADDVAAQLERNQTGSDPAMLRTTFAADLGVNDPGDILGMDAPGGTAVAVHAGGVMSTADPLLSAVLGAVHSGSDTLSDSGGAPWLVVQSPVASSTGVVFVARPVSADFLTAIDHNLVTAADPADLAVVAGSRFAIAGTLAGHAVAAGEQVPAAIASMFSAPVTVGEVWSSNVAVASAALGGPFRLVVSTPVGAVSAAWQPVVLLVGLILLAMCIIVVVVQSSLQRPLRRLDRAVAALGRGEFDVPLPSSSDDELRRLSTTFEAMRRRLQATIRASDARATIATELNAAQPLETALAKVCAELRGSLNVDSALIVVAGSEMNDAFAIVDGGVTEETLVATLSGDGPLGEGVRHDGPGALLLCAAPASHEAALGLREFLVAPLRLGAHAHGVVAVANCGRELPATDADLVASTAEQLALAVERYRILAVVQRQATMDDLTGLYNHRFFVDYLGQQVALAERLGAPLAVLMMDIDHFKALNDTYGHQAGDTALAAFAQTVTGSVRRSDLAARYGGEEFAVIMANTTADDARIVADKIRVAASEMRVDIPGHEPTSVTVSIGGAAYPEDTDSAGELLSLADAALYRAKRTGRDRTCMAADNRRRSGQRRALVNLPHTGTATGGMEAVERGRRRSPE